MDRRIWVEKTMVKEVRERQIGPQALGAALVSPQKSQSGSDIYRFMRDVAPGDLILHLTDNQGFTGISRVSARATEFERGTVLRERWYSVQLTKFTALRPPLNREQFFSEQFWPKLQIFARPGQYVFFSSRRRLRQGSYLTPLSSEVLKILDNAYLHYSNRSLLEVLENVAERD